MCVESSTERVFAMEKVRFSHGNLRLIRINNFENRSVSNGQKVVRMELNSAWIIPCVRRV